MGKNKKKEPTFLQKKLITLISENISKKGKKTMGQLLIEAGYSKSVSESPQRVTESKSWKDLLEEYLPDNDLMVAHKKLLNKQEYIAIGKKGEREVIPTGEIDPQAVGKGLDMAYKLKGRYAPEKIDVRSMLSEFDEVSDDELSVKVKSK